MKILFLNAYFFPEINASSYLEKDLIQALLDEGHQVEVLCPVPTRGISDETAKAYRKITRESIYDGKCSVRRFLAPREGRNPLVRALRYFWCNLRMYQLGKKYRDIDAVFTVSTPPTQGLLAAKVSRKLGCPFVYSLQDVFPDSMVAAGLTKQGSLVWKVGRWLENKTYALANHIVVISKACRQNLLDKGVPMEKITLISNWCDTDCVVPVSREANHLIQEFGLDPECFLAVYAGNLGAAQGAQIILEAAKLLKKETKIQFVIFGGGAGFADACRYVRENHLDNVQIHPLLPQERISEIYSLGNIALVTCRAGISNCAMPSKVWNIMACNSYILASFDVDSELSQVLEESESGKCVAPESVEALAGGILDAYSMWQRGEVKPCYGREYVCAHADRKQCTRRYVSLITGEKPEG